jgi:hypothetical protein
MTVKQSMPVKRPDQPINEEVLSQIKKYAKAVAADDRFKAAGVEWDFLAVSNKFTRDAEMDARQANKPRLVAILRSRSTPRLASSMPPGEPEGCPTRWRPC